MKFTQTSQSIVPGENAIISVDGVSVLVPKESIDNPGNVTISIRDLSTNPIIEDYGWSFDKVANIEYFEFGTTYNPEKTYTPNLIVCFELTEDQWVNYTSDSTSYYIRRFHSTTQSWESLEPVSHDVQKVICGETENLSLFALAHKSPEETPSSSESPEPTSTLEGIYEP
jgi:hypothetical protein